MIDATIVFVHIPKTAGSTLSTVLDKQFAPEACWFTGGRGTTHKQANLDYAALPEAERRRYRYVAGHLELFVVAAAPAPCFAFTFLREPVERMLSMYYYIRRQTTHHLHHLLAEKNLSIPEFFAGGYWHELDNGMVRRLSGVQATVPYGGCGERELDAARRNLADGLSFFGLQERFDESMSMLARHLGSEAILGYESRNVTRDRPTYDDVPEADREAITRYNELDRELYAFAVGEYARRAAAFHAAAR